MKFNSLFLSFMFVASISLCTNDPAIELADDHHVELEDLQKTRKPIILEETSTECSDLCETSIQCSGKRKLLALSLMAVLGAAGFVGDGFNIENSLVPVQSHAREYDPNWQIPTGLNHQCANALINCTQEELAQFDQLCSPYVPLNNTNATSKKRDGGPIWKQAGSPSQKPTQAKSKKKRAQYGVTHCVKGVGCWHALEDPPQSCTEACDAATNPVECLTTCINDKRIVFQECTGLDVHDQAGARVVKDKTAYFAGIASTSSRAIVTVLALGVMFFEATALTNCFN